MDVESKVVSSSLPLATPFAMCMNCETEHPADQPVCPTCGLALSIVRRCPGCDRIVSARHPRCIYCSQPLAVSAVQDVAPAGSEAEIAKARLRRRELIEHRIRQRAALVSIATFILVFVLGLIFIARMKWNSDAKPRVIAKSYILRSTAARRAPAHSSAEIARLSPGDVIDISDFRANDDASRWAATEWNGATAFIPISDFAPPKIVSADRGADLLKFYLLGMNEPNVVPDAAQAIEHFATTFPAAANVAELRWLLADRARHLAAQSAQRDALLREARNQYEILAQSSGDYSERARRLLSGSLSALPEKTSAGAGSSRPATPSLQVVTGSSDAQKYGGFTKSPAHEVLLLDQSKITTSFDIPVLSQPSTVVNGRVARTVYVGRVPAIPAGSPCVIEIRDNPSLASPTASLLAVVVRDRRYELQSSTVEIKRATGSSTGRAADFVLQTPVAITR